MATTGRIQVSSPRMTIQSSSTETGNFYGDLPSPVTVPYTFPFPGTVTKVLVNTLPGTNFGGGSLVINYHPLSGSGDINLPPLALVAATGLEEYSVNYPFNATDGFMYDIVAPNVGAKFTITLEVEYSLI